MDDIDDMAVRAGIPEFTTGTGGIPPFTAGTRYSALSHAILYHRSPVRGIPARTGEILIRGY